MLTPWWKCFIVLGRLDLTNSASRTVASRRQHSAFHLTEMYHLWAGSGQILGPLLAELSYSPNHRSLIGLLVKRASQSLVRILHDPALTVKVA